MAAAAGKKFQNSARSVPTWEKRFCWEVGALPWKRLERAKKYLYDFHDVMLWDDSAAKEAFDKAKLRYRMKINGQPCKIPLPSPDIYIDKIDWNPNNSVVPGESELLEDLDESSSPCEEEEKVIINSIDVPFDQMIPTGWDVDYYYGAALFNSKNRLLSGMLVVEY